MNSDVKALWVASLKDGSFKQGKFGLRDLDDYYDAQGVLCELAVSAGVIDPPTKHTKPEASVFFGYIYGPKDNRTATGLPKAVCEWAGIEYRLAYSIGLMGDNGKKFTEIADWIEENL